ncbi:MAG: GAF domain-containing protein [Chloroflexota bacterium]|nr:GAF domain-containing protein [Chloroflexota bacterium]
MMERISSWLAPTADDPDVARRQYLLNMVLLGLAGPGFLFGMVSAVLWALGRPSAAGALAGFGVQPFYLLAYWLGRRGRVRLAAYFPVVGVFLAMVGGSYQLGVGHATLIGYAMVTLTASLLIGNGAALFFVLLGTVAHLLVGMAQAAGGLPGAISPASTVVADAAGVGLGLIVLVIFEWLNNREMGRALQRERKLSAELETHRLQLERRVAERTADLERRSVQLEAAAQVARRAAAIRDVSRLLDETVRLVSDRFNFHHAGIFLVDEDGEWAVLQAASSEWGQRMLERGHKSRVGREGVVGSVVATGEPRIVLDTVPAAAFTEDPDMPQTRSEMALPLKTRDRVMGVLDMHSAEPEAFSEEDVAVLQTMADQVALTIENARLLGEAEERLLEIDALIGRQSREGWGRMAAERPGWGYVYDGVEVVPREEALAAETKPQLMVPLQVRGRRIGNLNLVLGDRSPTPEDEALAQAIADQASQALESARFYQDAQHRAARERLTGQVTARMRETLDVDTVLQTAVREMRERLNLAEAEVRMGTPAPVEM